VALPVILFNTTTGSDTTASGAGPSIAVSGTASAHTNGINQSTILFTNNPNLSGISTDGSAVLWLKTSSGRQFTIITAVNNSSKTVTVADLFNIPSGSAVNWAIGGKRATWSNTDSRKLFSDVKNGWTVETETNQTLSSTAIMLSASQTGSSPIVVRGSTEHVTLTKNNTSAHFEFSSLVSGIWTFEKLRFLNTSLNVGTAFSTGVSTLTIKNCIFGSSTNKLNRVINYSGGGDLRFMDCEISTASIAILLHTSGSRTMDIIGCWIHDCEGAASSVIDIQSSSTIPTTWNIKDCIFDNIAGNAISISSSTASTQLMGNIQNCTFDGCAVGLKLNGVYSKLCLLNNIFSNNTTAINAVAGQEAFTFGIDYNNFYNNGTDRVNFPIGPNDTVLDPQYVNRTGNDYSIGTNLRALGFPSSSQSIGLNQSRTNNFTDIGGAQRREAD
jgi:hypothetical protein